MSVMRTEALLVPPMLAVLCGCTAAHAVKPEDIQQCLNVAQDNGLVMVSTEERSRLQRELVHQIESSQAMKPNEAPEYRQLLFRSDRNSCCASWVLACRCVGYLRALRMAGS